MKLQAQNTHLCSKGIWLAISLICWFLSAPVSAQEATPYTLQLSPEKCVALRQGQDCYVDIQLNWSAPQSGQYCISASTLETPLRCWSNQEKGSLELEFSSNQNTWFYLKQGEQTLAKVELKMAWVYKSKRSSVTWRVF
ncbi:hypothetical protein MACH26_39980 [Planctobacterium marinum]|uniref:DUF3019 domain-containing protein n=2 Tax=Planctobacterium marinum TaxID=1631968 RepID=A0AA48KTR9_9ALTE|nr:hypothetical protein MACH26_39980 [Planctobacterium marinum]